MVEGEVEEASRHAGHFTARAYQELRDLEHRLARLQQANPTGGSTGFTKAGIRKMIARLPEEMAVYEGSEEAREPHSK